MTKLARLLLITTVLSPLVMLDEAEAQCSGQPSGNRVCASPSGGGAGVPNFRTLIPTDLVQGSGGGTTNFLRADGVWAVPAGGGGGAVTSVFGRIGVVVAQSGDYSFSLISGQTVLGQLPNAGANTILGATAAGAPSYLAVPSCSGASNALTWTSGVGFGCNTISGGALSPITADNVLGNPTAASATPVGMQLPNCAGGATALNYSTATHLFSCNSISGGAATSITVGTTTVGAGVSGRLLFDNAGVLGELATLTASLMPAYTGDVTSAVGTTVNTLASVITAGGPIGSATTVPVITFDTKGRLTVVTSAAISIPFTSVTGSVAASQLPAFTGDVTSPAGSTVNTIVNSAVTNAKMANMTANTVKGRGTGTGAPADLAMTSCSGATNALTWTTGTGFGCNTIAAGGTPAAPTNSIQFNNAGAFGGDAALTWDNTNKLLVINSSGSPLVASNADIIQLQTGTGAASGIAATGFGGFASYVDFRKAAGTASAPSATLNATNVGYVAGAGWEATNQFSDAAQILFTTAENWAPTAHGMMLRFMTTSLGSTTVTEALRIQPSGGVSIGSPFTDPNGPGLYITAKTGVGGATTNQALHTSQFLVNALTTPANFFQISGDQGTVGTGQFSVGWQFVHSFGNGTGNREAVNIVLSQDAPTTGTVNGQFVGLQTQVLANTGDGGTVGAEKGFYYSLGGYSKIVGTNTPHVIQVNTQENDMEVQSGATTLEKYGYKITQTSADAVQGSANDAAYVAVNQTGAIGWKNFLQLGDGVAGRQPLASNGTVLAVKSAQTLLGGIDLATNVTFSGAGNFAFKSPGFTVDGSGNLSAANFQLTNGCSTAVNATITCSSSTAFTPSLSYTNNAADTTSAIVRYQKTRGGGIITAGDDLGSFEYWGHGGGGLVKSAVFKVINTGSPGAIMPSAIGFIVSSFTGNLVHQLFFGSQGHLQLIPQTAPTISAGCNGAGSSVNAGSNDVWGGIQGQTTAVGTCTIQFGNAFAVGKPNCVVTGEQSQPLTVGFPDLQHMVITFTSVANYRFAWFCGGA